LLHTNNKKSAFVENSQVSISESPQFDCLSALACCKFTQHRGLPLTNSHI